MKKIILGGNIVISILILFASVSAFLIKTPVRRQIQEEQSDGSVEWYYEDGTSAELDNLHYIDNTTQVSRTLRAGSLTAYTLCFDTANVDFTVYLNEEAIYDYHPELLAIYGESYGLDFHAITIPYFEGEAELVIRAEDLSNGSMWAGFRNMFFENGATNILRSLVQDFLKCFLAFWVFAFGLIVLIFGLIIKQHDEQQLELVSLGTLSMILSIWTITSSYFLGMLTGNPGYIRALNYLSLMILPMAGITLVACLTKQTKSRFLLIIMALTFFNLSLHLVMLFSGQMDYHDLLILSHIVFLLGVILAIILIVRSIRQNKLQERQQIVILVAFLILMSSGMADLFLYYFKHSKDASTLSRFGLLIFVIMLGSYEVHEFILITQKNREMEVVRRLAYEDGLTGLENRLSFNEYEAELKQKTSGKCAVVQLDINNLKKVNDTFGHAVGDDFIRTCAEIIASSFGEYGRVFRTGGDEFISVFMVREDGEDVAGIYEKCVKEMLEKLAWYNQKMEFGIPLAIAYGMAECDLETEDLAAAEIKADERMYERKRKMKDL